MSPTPAMVRQYSAIPALFHDGDLICHVAHHAQVVRDEQIGGRVLLLQRGQLRSGSPPAPRRGTGDLSSSQIAESGPPAKARAMNTAFFSQPEIWCGYYTTDGVSPVSPLRATPTTSVPQCLAVRRPAVKLQRPRPRSASTVQSGFCAACRVLEDDVWIYAAARPLRRRTSAGTSFSGRTLPSSSTSPCDARANVVFPEPLSPTTAAFHPAAPPASHYRPRSPRFWPARTADPPPAEHFAKGTISSRRR